MIRLSTLCLVLALSVNFVYGDNKIPKVPSDMQFAGMKLKITEAARKDIQKDVDALRGSPKYFNIKLDRAKLYFPIIERVLEENNVPDDFKYLAIQESALISDAVSSANAVGFWQFKDFTGREVGLRIDRNIDERLNIVASTIGASKYFKRHNFFFKNWVYTLLAHMTGRGGAKKYVDESKFGDRKMTIDRNTHWYVKRFLAHKIAFEKELKGKHSEGLKLVEYKKGRGKSLSEIAKDFKIEYDELKRYNKWLKKGKVPSEKEYTVIIPIKSKVPKGMVAQENRKPKSPEVKDDTPVEKTYPSIRRNLNTGKTIFIRINGIPSVLAKNADTPESLARKGEVSLARFLKYNDLESTDAIIEGEIYYLKPKKSKANIHYHTVTAGESLWDVSQKFGIKLKKLAKFNRMLTIDEPSAGRVLWMREQRPKGVPIEINRAVAAEASGESVMRNDKPLPVARPVVAEEKEVSKPDVNNVADSTVVEEPKLVEEKPEEPEPLIEEPIDPEPEVTEDKPKSSGGNERHTVQKGETLYGISRKYGVSVEDLMSLNGLKGSSLNVGQTLAISGSAPQNGGSDKESTKKTVLFHVVEPGDTMYGISRKYNISVERLLQINQKDNFGLSIGEKIRVAE